MSKVDLDKLMCSLTKFDIVGTYLASCFQDALREQGLVCDDGKIKNINDKPDDTPESDEPIEIKEGNYYKCNHAYNCFSLGSIYYSPKDGFLMDDYGHGIDVSEKSIYFEFAYTIAEYPTESKEDEEVNEPTKIKKGGVYKCLCNCMNRNFINKGVYVSEEDNHLTNLFGESIDVGLIPQYFEELSIPDEEKPENAIEIKAGNWYRCLKTMPNLNFCKDVNYYSPNDCCLYNDDGESVQYGDRTSSFELVHLDKTVEEEMEKLVHSDFIDDEDFNVKLELKKGNWYKCLVDNASLKFEKDMEYYCPDDCYLYNDDLNKIDCTNCISKFEFSKKDDVGPIVAGNDYICIKDNFMVGFRCGRLYHSNTNHCLISDDGQETGVGDFIVQDYFVLYNKAEIDVDKMCDDYALELGDDYTFLKVQTYKRGIKDILEKLNITL